MIKRIFFVSAIAASLLIINGCSENSPVVTIYTDMGNIDVELYPGKAPVTVTNFFRYVDSSLFRNGCFYRIVRMDNQPKDSVRIEVIQG
jgi:peptidyl-prolyl cis-trans isomerase A (cyclophilin A)